MSSIVFNFLSSVLLDMWERALKVSALINNAALHQVRTHLAIPISTIVDTKGMMSGIQILLASGEKDRGGSVRTCQETLVTWRKIREIIAWLRRLSYFLRRFGLKKTG